MDEVEESSEMIFKIILIGDPGTGKTNILSKYIKNTFNENSKATVGVELSTKSFTINNNIVNTQIWDTAGQERYKSLTKAYYKGALGALVVYDITNKVTFDNTDKWIYDLRISAEEKISVILIGNKNDLKEQRQVSKEFGEDKAKSFGVAFMETSAKTGDNIEVAFKSLIEDVYNKFHKNFESTAQVEIMRGKTIKIEESKTEKKKCCSKESFPFLNKTK